MPADQNGNKFEFLFSSNFDAFPQHKATTQNHKQMKNATGINMSSARLVTNWLKSENFKCV